jgi:hypothetical protein
MDEAAFKKRAWRHENYELIETLLSGCGDRTLPRKRYFELMNLLKEHWDNLWLHQLERARALLCIRTKEDLMTFPVPSWVKPDPIHEDRKSPKPNNMTPNNIQKHPSVARKPMAVQQESGQFKPRPRRYFHPRRP